MALTQVGKYQLVSKLATGGMAEVFLARVEGPMGFEKTLVLKRILPHLAEDPTFVGMFFTEARVAAQLNHPHIVQIFDFGQADGTYYLAMEYIDGPDLRTLSARAIQAGVPLPPTFCAKVISAVCEGLAFAHDFVDPSSGRHLELIHRDISTDNILLSRQGAVKVVDFGIAKASNQSHKTKTGLIKGKIAYMPVEQLQGQQLDRRADVYALGVVLYELLTGQLPFEATTDVSMMQAILFEPLVPAASRRPDLPEALCSILDRALAKVREQRYPDCITFQADLERFILSTGQSVGARDLAQCVERLCPRNSGPARPSPTGEKDIGFNATAMSPMRTPTGEPRPGSMAAPLDADKDSRTHTDRTHHQTALSHPSAQDKEPPLAPTLISPSRRDLPAVHTGQYKELPLAPTAISPSRNDLPAVSPATTDTQKPAAPAQTERFEKEDVALGIRQSRARLGLAVGGLVLLAAGSGVVLFRSNTAPPAPMQAAPTPAPEPKPVAVAPPPAEPPVAEKVAPPTGPQPVEASAPVAAGEKPSPEPTPQESTEAQPTRRKGAQKAKLEFRIRPYATVFLDGKPIGQTPFAPVQVSVGPHTVRLINRDLDKDITRTIEVKAGQPNIVKQDLTAD
uniref:protein kinase domain-containing protein n=1 Tax=Archangium lansingense TaxID=2995310 RepID=UPI00358DAB25